ncbi:MFS general substrate transporter [Auriscalpium vulgare]|uniref:MFS general substrate transporter n=1 Tax=Auriscalpium vulgare TaxID=40419 RepID=A0ACB8RPI0_9AGAM|nr:MFS general substrate transporter [Auriscalpium vulgare]
MAAFGSDSTVNEHALAPVDSGFGAWSFLAGAYMVETIVWGFPNAFGVFLKAYLDDPSIAAQPHAASVLPLVGTLSSGIIYCSGPFIYPFTSRYPHHRRTAMWIGSALCWASLFGASYATTVMQLVFLQGVLYALGGALLYAPTMSYLSEWFVRRRGLANGVVFAGTATGGLLLPLIIPPLIRAHGTATTLRYLSVALLLSLLPTLPLVRPRLPEHRVHGPGPRSSENGVWMKSWTWWLLLAVNTVQGFAYFLPIIWLPTYASSVGSMSTSSLSLALLNGASVFGRIMMGTLADHLSPWLLAISTLGSTSIVTFTLWGVGGRDAPLLLLFGVLYGLFAAGWSSLWTGFLRHIARDDPTLSTTLFGFLLFSRGVGNLLSTPISTALSARPSSVIAHEKTGFDVADGRFERMIVYVGTCFAGAAVVAMVGWGGDRVLKRRSVAA